MWVNKYDELNYTKRMYADAIINAIEPAAIVLMNTTHTEKGERVLTVTIQSPT